MSETKGITIETLTLGPLATNCYLVSVGLAHPKEAIIVDPADEPERIVRAIEARRLKPILMVNTHGHADHIAAAALLKEAYPEIEYLIHRADAPMLRDPNLNLSSFLDTRITAPTPDRLLDDGSTLRLRGVSFRVIHVPGHTPGGICLYTEDTSESPVLFSGDALFFQGIGRTDLPGGDLEKLLSALRTRVLVLDPRTIVYPGHGPPTTIGEEREMNPFLGDELP